MTLISKDRTGRESRNSGKIKNWRKVISFYLIAVSRAPFHITIFEILVTIAYFVQNKPSSMLISYDFRFK